MKMNRRLNKTQSPVVNASFQRHQRSKISRAAGPWLFINVILATCFLSELMWGSIANFLEWHHPILWYIECTLAVWFTISFLTDLFLYLRPVVATNNVLVTPHQKRLLGIKQTDSGFKVLTQDKLSPSTNQSAPTSPLVSSLPGYLPRGLSVTPPKLTTTSSSPRLSGYSQPSYYDKTTPDARSRHSSPRKSPYSPSDCINNMNSLRDYLREQEEEESKLQRVLSDSLSQSRSPSYWSPYRNDFTPQLGVYRIARRSPDSSLSRDDDDSAYSSSRAEEMWLRIGVTREDLDYWTENCRKWLCQTILQRLVEQINSINDTLCRIGCQELQVGTISLSSLRHVSQAKADQVPFLQVIIPYLEALNNQEYLVQRIRELAKGGCMSVFRWNSGGKFRGKEWESDLLTDSQIVMHMFCTYMDSRLPADPRFPDGGTFTGLHFLKTPDNPDARKSDLCIYMSRLHSPHYKVVIEDEVFDLAKGRNNLFHAIIFFLNHIKTHQNGMLGRVNLGLSGVNILCIINKK